MLPAVALTVAAVTIIFAGTLSLALYLPLSAIAESVSPSRPAARARIWLVGLHAPLIGGFLLALASVRLAANVYASPHAEVLRPHICFLSLAGGPDGPFRMTVIAFAAAGLLVAAVVRLLAGAASSMRLRRLAAELVDPNAEVPVALLSGGALKSYTVGLARPIAVLSGLEGVNLPDDQRQAVIAHELKHVARRDNLTDLANAASLTALIFAPTAHLYRSNWHQETEYECDDAAARVLSPETVARALKRFGAGEGAAEQPLVQRRLERLATANEDDAAVRDPALMLLFLGLGLLAVGVAAWVARRQGVDTLHCAATSFLGALRR